MNKWVLVLFYTERFTEKNHINREPIIGAHVMGTKRQGYWVRKDLKH